MLEPIYARVDLKSGQYAGKYSRHRTLLRQWAIAIQPDLKD
ncbi:hypothetical protein [Candidatus Tisiphia endosymbiont of Ptychoptera albimana]